VDFGQYFGHWLPTLISGAISNKTSAQDNEA